MSAWIIFILISELMWAFTSLFDKILLSRGHIKSPFVFIAFNGMMNFLLIFLLPFFRLGTISFSSFVKIMIAGTCLSMGIIFYYKAVQHEEISRVLMLWQLGPVFILIFSFLFLHESFTRYHLLGFFLLLTAGILVSYKKSGRAFHFSKAFYLMVASTLLISAYYIISKFIYMVTNFWNAFIWLRLAGFSALIVLTKPSIRKEFVDTVRNMSPSAKSLISVKMLIDFSAFILLGYAMLTGPVYLINALGSAAAPVFIFLITTLTSIYLPNIVKENIDKRSIITKLSAIILIIAGIFFINLA